MSAVAEPNSPVPDPAKRAAAILRQCEVALVDGSPQSLAWVDVAVRELEKTFSEIRLGPEYTFQQNLAIAVATTRGHLCRRQSDRSGADRAYATAIDIVRRSSLYGAEKDRKEAGLWTYRGLASLDSSNREHWLEAVSQFENAIEIRERENGDHRVQWGMAAAWMNHGDALARLGGYSNLHSAISSNERAVELLGDFDLSANPAFRTRMALAYLNQGEYLSRLVDRFGHPGEKRALDSFLAATEVLRAGVREGAEESKRILAVALANLARCRLLLDGSGSDEGEREAREALALVESFEMEGVEVNRLRLNARIALCRAIEANHGEEAAAEITDLVEAGLRESTHLLTQYESFPEDLDDLCGQLFRCGAEAYRRYLPDFLTEYLYEFLDPEHGGEILSRSPACHEAAVQNLWLALADLKRDGFGAQEKMNLERRLALESDWEKCRGRLAVVRSTRFVT